MLSTKSETRIIRPFLGASGIRGFMNDAELHLCENDIDSRKENRTISEFEFDDAPILRPNLSETELSKIEAITGLGRSNFNLAVWMTVQSAKTFRLLKTVTGEAMTDPEGFAITTEIFDAAKRRGGVEISIALVLNTDLEEAPLRPDTYGQWLVKKDFKLSLQDDDSNQVDLQELTEEVRVRFGLPELSTYFVDLRESAVLTEPGGTIKGAMTIYIDADTLQRLRRGAKASHAIQTIIIGEIIPRLISEALRRSEVQNFAELDTSCPLYNLFKEFGEVAKRQPGEVFDVAIKHPDRLPAFVQSYLRTISVIKEMI